MLKILFKNKRWKDYIDYKSAEVKIAACLGIILTFIFLQCGIYEDFDVFFGAVAQVLSIIMSGYISIIGFSLSGVAIIISLFSRKTLNLIEKVNGDGTFEQMMSTFVFLGFNSAIGFIITVVTYFLINMPREMVSKFIFIIIMFGEIYFTLFNIFYVVALIAYCLKVVSIRNVYEKIEENQNLREKANEIRIDLLFKALVEKYHISQEEFLKALENAVNESDSDEKENLIQYFRSYYRKK